MTDLRKAAEMALDALETKGEHHKRVYAAIKALRQALAQPEQEPVAYIDHVSGKPKFIDGYVVQTDYDIPLYTAPPKREWVGLTDDEMTEIWEKSGWYVRLFESVEAKLEEKNT